MEDHAWWTTLKIDGRREAILSQSQRSIYKEMLILGLLTYHFFACGACNANVTVGYLTYSLVFLFWGGRGPGSQNRRGGGALTEKSILLRPWLTRTGVDIRSDQKQTRFCVYVCVFRMVSPSTRKALHHPLCFAISNSIWICNCVLWPACAVSHSSHSGAPHKVQLQLRTTGNIKPLPLAFAPVPAPHSMQLSSPGPLVISY